MEPGAIHVLRALKYGAILLCALTLVGIAVLMYISWDKDEDITGIVAPALLIAIMSAFAAIVAAVLQRRAQKELDQNT